MDLNWLNWVQFILILLLIIDGVVGRLDYQAVKYDKDTAERACNGMAEMRRERDYWMGLCHQNGIVVPLDNEEK